MLWGDTAPLVQGRQGVGTRGRKESTERVQQVRKEEFHQRRWTGGKSLDQEGRACPLTFIPRACDNSKTTAPPCLEQTDGALLGAETVCEATGALIQGVDDAEGWLHSGREKAEKLADTHCLPQAATGAPTGPSPQHHAVERGTDTLTLNPNRTSCG